MTNPNNPIFNFSEAERVQCKASIMIEGLSGRGKSGLALLLGYYLAGEDWTKVFDIDTENGSIKLFTGVTSSADVVYEKFQIGDFQKSLGYKPSNYLAFREAAIKNGAKVVIEDSISHAWMYQGGVLDLLNAAKQADKRYAKDSYAAWSEETVAKEKLLLFELLRDNRCHVITTVRVKEKMDYGSDSEGKTKLISLGEQQIMQGDTKFEPDLVIQMLKAGKNKAGDITHPKAFVVKSRYAILTEGDEYEFTPALMRQLREYLEEGTSPEELLEKQRQEYITGVKSFLDAKPGAVPIWSVLKKDAGFDKTELKDLPLDVIKTLFIKLTID